MVRMRYGLLAALLVAAAVGCGGGKVEGVTVTGTVTLDGEPLPRGQVVMEADNHAEQFVGGIGEGGKFEVNGVPPGRVRVAVRTSMFKGLADAHGKFAQKGSGGKADPPKVVMVPAKYESAATSGLEYTVEAGKPIDIALKK